MDGSSGAGVAGPVGYGITGSGGGGARGRYVFASLAELDGIIADWEALRDAIRGDGDKLMQAQLCIEPPAEDVMSRLEANVTVASLGKAREHNLAMADYADSYIAKLRASRAGYAATDANNASLLRHAGEG